MKRILVVEDEDAIREFVVINLQRAGYDVVEANSGEAALQKYEENHGEFDVAILDIMMPGIDGLTVCKELRKKSGNLGIIMLTAKTQEMDKVTGLMLEPTTTLPSRSAPLSWSPGWTRYTAGWRLRKCGRKIISRRSWFPAILY